MNKIGLNIGTYDKCCFNCLYSESGFWGNLVKCSAFNFYPFKELVCKAYIKR